MTVNWTVFFSPGFNVSARKLFQLHDQPFSANPVTLYALQDGHAEELLGAVLCVAAVLAAQRGRGGLAALALGLAIANKQWALLAIGPVLLALPPGRRARPLALAGAVVLCIDLPLWLASGSGQPGGGAGSARRRGVRDDLPAVAVVAGSSARTARSSATPSGP